MARKKAQHLYELLGKKAPAGAELLAELPKAVKPAAPSAAGPVKPRPVYTPPALVPAPAPSAAGREHVLENVVTIRRDTAIVAILMIVVAVVGAFVLGWYAAPRHIQEKGPVPGFQEPTRQPLMEPGEPESPPTGREQEETGAAEEETSRPEPASAPEPEPAAQPQEQWEVRASSLPASVTGAKESLEKACQFLVKKGYAAAEVVRKGNHWVLRVPGYASFDEAQADQRKIENLEFEGRRDFATAQVRRMSR